MSRQRILTRPPLNLPFLRPKGFATPAQEWSNWLRLVGEYLRQAFPFKDDERVCWDDLEVALSSSQPGPGASASPSWSTFKTNTKAWQFSGTAMNELFFVKQVRHRYKPGTTIHPHIHFSQNGTATSAITWGLDYTIASPFDAFPAEVTTTVDATPTGVTHDHEVVDFDTAIAGTGIVESALIVGRVYRAGNTDANNNGAFGLSVDFHFAAEKLGTRNIYPELA